MKSVETTKSAVSAISAFPRKSATRTLATCVGLLVWGTLAAQAPPKPDDFVKTLVARLSLDRYKTTIKELTRFGDRRQGTDRNRAAVDWIEAQLKSYGCTNTERIHYEWAPRTPPLARFPAAEGGGVIKGQLGSRLASDNDPDVQPDPRLRQLNMQPSTPGPVRRFSARKSAQRIPRKCTS